MATLVSLHTPEAPWSYRDGSIIVGKDILEILSSAMYVDPLAIYREYIQNAADSVDEAHNTGILGKEEEGNVEIEIDLASRTAKIRDNGTGVPAAEFDTRMTAFGASSKRNTNSRGFRGVGRLSGLGYCQELLFRSRYSGETSVSELRWDCRKARTLLRSADPSCDLTTVVGKSVQARRVDGRKWPEHFFEVELRGVTRLRNDWLLNTTVIEEYLSQVAPISFSPQFRFGGDIASMLGDHVGVTNMSLKLANNKGPTFRPHRDSFDVAGGTDMFEELHRVDIPGLDGGTAAVGWILHHGYKGAVPSANLKGLRLRSGNIQVGGSGLLEDLFAEPRFNSWCVGEIHILDQRILPNGRRDHYEQNAHYYNLVNHLSPIAREVSNRCRSSSIKRNWLRQFALHKFAISENAAIIRQGGVNLVQRKQLEADIARSLEDMRKIAGKDPLSREAKSSLRPAIKRVERTLSKLLNADFRAKALADLPSQKRRAYEQVLSLVYECSPSRSVAKSLVDKILSRLS